MYVYNTAKYNNDVIRFGEWVLTGIYMHTALTYIDFRFFVPQKVDIAFYIDQAVWCSRGYC